jgi:hypothetical protein
MSSAGAAPRAAVSVSSARAEASRRNGARSRGPRTAEGKARSAQNALKHGLRAEKYVVLLDEDRDEFAALEAAFIDELAPAGALQRVLAGRVARAAWRLMRADRLEVELFEERGCGERGVGLALIRDGNGTRSFETLLRYRGAAQAELWRALRTLKALQAEQAATFPASAAGPAAVLMLQPKRRRTSATLRAPTRGAGEVEPRDNPIEPEAGGKPGESGPVPSPDQPGQLPGPARTRTDEPEPAPRGAACAPVARAPAERTPSWAGRGRGGGSAGSGTNGARSGRTAPGAPQSGCAARPQLARSTP